MLKNFRDYWIIKKSGLFDPVYYLMKYPDVRRADIDPLMHFIRFGWKEGRLPSNKINLQNYYKCLCSENKQQQNSLILYIREYQVNKTRFSERVFLKITSLIKSYKYRISDLLKSKEINMVKGDEIYTNNHDELNYESNIKDKFNSALEISFENFSITKHQDNIDIIICIHNALEDVRKCLLSLEKNTSKPYRIILIDDGSDIFTKEFLEEYSRKNSLVSLFRNEIAKGYTFAANKGMHESNSEFIILLNSDTILTPNWIDLLYSVISSEKNIGIVGPLSNVASWQSVPKLEEGGDWALNPLPKNISIDQMGELIFKYSGHIWPKVPLLNGFCLCIRKEVIDSIGYFDEKTFGEGYGEEDDFMIRAQEMSWKAVIVDDAYIYHAQSKSYSNEKRKILTEKNGQKLLKKHGQQKINHYVNFMASNRVLDGIRGRTEIMFEREDYLKEYKEKYDGKKILFILPITDAGGGGNVVINVALVMQKLGIDASIFNLDGYENSFKISYPNLKIKQLYGQIKDLVNLMQNFDAVIGTVNYPIECLKPLENNSNLKLGYFIQDYDPFIYNVFSEEYRKIHEFYSLKNKIIPFTKTNWKKDAVFLETGITCKNIGISVDIDLFRPHKTILFGRTPVSITTMIKQTSAYRSSQLTIKILHEIKRKFGKKVEINIFGSEDIFSTFSSEELNFPFHSYDILNQQEVSNLLNNTDIFVDLSSHKEMYLTALEAMACGGTVIVPQNGDAAEFVNHRGNGLIVDINSQDNCFYALQELIQNNDLRAQLQKNATHDVCKYYPEKPACLILDALFGEEK